MATKFPMATKSNKLNPRGFGFICNMGLFLNVVLKWSKSSRKIVAKLKWKFEFKNILIPLWINKGGVGVQALRRQGDPNDVGKISNAAKLLKCQIFFFFAHPQRDRQLYCLHYCPTFEIVQIYYHFMLVRILTNLLDWGRSRIELQVEQNPDSLSKNQK